MVREIRRIEPMRFANILAVVYASIFVVFVLVMAPFFLFAPLKTDSGQELQRGVILAFLAGYPVMGAFMGWVGGLVFSGVYNVVAKRLGGVRLEIGEGVSV